MAKYYLGLGANLGDRADTLKQARAALDAFDTTEIIAVSAIYETPPWGLVDQPAFYNQCLIVRSDLDPHVLLDSCQVLETSLGRVREEKWGPRYIDIDILAWDGEPVSTSRLTIPHPYAAERAFVLIPLHDIAPHLCLDGQTVSAYVAALSPADKQLIVPIIPAAH